MLPNQYAEAHHHNAAKAKEDLNILSRQSAAVVALLAMAWESVTGEENKKHHEEYEALGRTEAKNSCDWKKRVHACFAERQR